MKKFYGFYTMIFMSMILIIATSASSFFAGDGKGVFVRDRAPGIKANDTLVNASTTLRDREAVPEGLTKTEWGKIRTTIERDQYRLHIGKHKNIYQATNNAHDMSFTFTQEGLQVRLKKQEGAQTWGLRLKGYGYGPNLYEFSEVEKCVVQNNRIEYHRREILEWFINDHRGLEQGFTLQQRLAGRRDAAPLELHLTSTSHLVPELANDGKAIAWKNKNGETVFRYSGLVAYDAAGKEINARMDVDQEGIQLIIEDHDAVYPITIDPFIETKKINASDGESHDYFGVSLSIDGDMAIVGAPGNDDNGESTGSAYIFYRDYGGADNWGQVKKLLGSDADWYSNFGSSVSISGDRAIVGAPPSSGSGKAYIFSRNRGGADNWGELAILTASDGVQLDRFGESVSISGGWAIVGASYGNGNEDEAGTAYIYRRVLDLQLGELWIQVKKLRASDGERGENFGASVSISGDTAIVGAYDWDNDNSVQSGSAYIFSRNLGGTNNWGERVRLTASDAAHGDNFGHSVSISGGVAIVGAPLKSYNAAQSGSAYIYHRVYDLQLGELWIQVKKLTASDGDYLDRFGVSVSSSGDRAIVGAYHNNDNGDESGSAYIFSRNLGGINKWGEVEKILANDGAADDYFGCSVSISGGSAIIGASGNDDNGNESGSAYVYDEVKFIDVPSGYWAEAAIYKIYDAGITTGCSQTPLKYCPEDPVIRTQMAVFLGRAIHGSGFTPPAATGIFADVPVSYWAADWIEQFYNDGITSGCSTNPLKYCPYNNVTRAQMAIFLLRSKHGSGYTPPAATGIFADVPVTYWAASWIEQLYHEGITTGCSTGPLKYCPDSSVTRAQMAVFITRTFGL